MREWEVLQSLYENAADPSDVTSDQVFDVYVRCCAVALSKQFVGQFEGKIYTDSKEFTEEYLEVIEDYLDLQSIYRIMDVCGGIKLEMDPNLMEALADD